jgi:hypothetical protein
MSPRCYCYINLFCFAQLLSSQKVFSYTGMKYGNEYIWVPKITGVSQLAEQLLSFQERHCAIQLVRTASHIVLWYLFAYLWCEGHGLQQIFSEMHAKMHVGLHVNSSLDKFNLKGNRNGVTNFLVLRCNI